jgi:hypothetical protein
VNDGQPGRAYFEEAYEIRGLPDVVAAEVVKKHIQYDFDRVGIEFGLQMALKPLIEVKFQEYEKENRINVHRPTWVDIPTKIGNMSKPQKIARTLGAMVRDGRIYFRPHLHKLFHQMDFLNPNSDSNEDDIVDAGSMMILTIPSFSASRWWMSDMKVDHGFTIESYMKKVNTKKTMYGKLAV